MDEQTPQHRMDLTAAQAAKLVKRTAPETDKDGKPTGKDREIAVRPDEVLSCAVRGSTVTVVTVDGQKLTGDAPPAKAEGGK